MEIFTVDAFTSKPFAGNPAAVCVLQADPLDPVLMQKIAAEMNLSETAFVTAFNPNDVISSASVFNLKWFTPVCEVNLCGHATLATAAVIFNCFKNPNSELVFRTLSGELKAIRATTNSEGYNNPKGSGADSTAGSNNIGIQLDLPFADTEAQDRQPIEQLIKLVIGDLPLVDCRYSIKTKKLLLRLADSVTREQLESLAPDTNAMVTAHSGKIRGVIVTVTAAERSYDFLSRYFAPWVGIPEDPVTGSAHSVLGPYWCSQLDKRQLKARQCSPRGGDLLVIVGNGDTVALVGGACIVMRGKLFI